MAKKGVYKISGNSKPTVGKKEFYIVDQWYPATPLSDRNMAKVTWELFIKTDNGFQATNIKKKGVNHFTFGKSAYKYVYKIEGYLHEPEGNSPMSLIVYPQKNEEKKVVIEKEIKNVLLTYENGNTINKTLSYRDRLQATATCEGLEGEKIVFKLWEDDEAKNGHNNKNQFITKSLPIEVNKFGKAKWNFALNPTFISLANKREDDKSKHEYYVTAEFNGKILEDSQNVNVTNPEYKIEQPQQLPQRTRRQPRGNSSPKPKQESPKASTRPNSPNNQPDKKGKILSIKLVDIHGKQFSKNTKFGDVIKLIIEGKDIVGQPYRLKLWEHDNSGKNDLLYNKEHKFNVNKQEVRIRLIDEYRKIGEVGNDPKNPDRGEYLTGNHQEIFAEVIFLGIKSESQRIDIDLKEEPKKETHNISPAKVEKTKISKANTSCVCKQYDLIWGEKVSCEFRKKVVEISKDLWPNNWLEMANGLMAVMKVETWGSFKAHHREGFKSANDNPEDLTIGSFHKDSGSKSSRAVGLIQFTQDALEGMNEFPKSTPSTKGTQPRYDALNRLKLSYAKMGEIRQLDKVKKYFEPAKSKIKTPEDIYLHVFAPEGVSKNDNYLLYAKGTDKYDNNKSVDKNNDGIQRKEILKRYYDSKNEGESYKTSEFSCGIISNNKNIKAIGIVTYHIYYTGVIEKHIPKEIKSGYEQKYKYVFHDKENKEHEICITDWHITTKKLPSRRKIYSKPTHSKIISDKNVTEGQTRRRVVYENGDIAEYGSNNGDTFWRLYESTSEQNELIKMPDSVSYVNYSFSGTKRRYTGPSYFAGFLGALAITELSISTTGSCFREGSCFPSQFHVNGESIDTIYFWNLGKDQKFIDAMKFFHFRERKAGNNQYFKRLRNVTDGGDLHDSHLHCGSFDESKIKIIKE